MTDDAQPDANFFKALSDKHECDEVAALNYDILAGGVYWSDEKIDVIDAGPGMRWWRMIIAHRMGLILGEDDRFPLLWSSVQTSANRWVGLQKARLHPNEATLETINALYNQANECIDRMFDEDD